MKKVVKPKVLIKAFKDAGLFPQYKLGEWLNIARPDGIHVEFYPCGPQDNTFFATYTLDNREQEFNFEMPDDLGLFVKTVCKILEHKPISKKVRAS